MKLISSVKTEKTHKTSDGSAISGPKAAEKADAYQEKTNLVKRLEKIVADAQCYLLDYAMVTQTTGVTVVMKAGS